MQEPVEDGDRPRGWHSRGFLPHYDGGAVLQSVTFGLRDAYPTHLLEQWRDSMRHLDAKEADREERRRIMGFLDSGHGECLLHRPELAKVAEETLLFDDGHRCDLHSWVIMPNHVHLLFRTLGVVALGEVVGGWKSISAGKINRSLGRTGSVWREDYFDRYIRDEEHYWNMVHYIELNPVKAGLCAKPNDYRWSSAHYKHHGM